VSPEELQAALDEYKALCASLPDGGAGQEMYLSDLGLE
jgi:3-dehydroquinate synthase